MTLRLLVATALLSLSSVAHADVRATYSDGSVIEINDDGSVLGDLVSDGHLLLTLNGADYLLVTDGDAMHVLDATIVEQVTNTYTPDFFAMMIAEVPPLAAKRAGTITVAGRSATGYRIDNEAKISFAISDDLELAPLGEAISRQFQAWTYMQGPLGRLSAPLGEIFATGAPVRFGEIDLVSVETVEIDDSRFALPGEPLDWFETEAVLLQTGLIEVSG